VTSLAHRVVLACALLAAAAAPGQDAGSLPRPVPEPPIPAGLKVQRLDVHNFRVVESYSGPVSYYKIIEDPAGPFIRSAYHPPLETVTLGIEIPDKFHQRAKWLRWRWRALVLPKGGNECRDGFGDSAAAVYVSWKRGLKWYSLKYVWSYDARKGQVCDQKRNLFVVQDTVILESGGPLNEWRTEEIDPAAEFRAHFENGNPNADVPDFVGLGIMSDGDQTNSISSADYTAFTLLH
jgi:DUF3047 family protein